MNLTRIRRLLRLVGLLQTGRGHNANALAVECRVNRRTIFRDLDVLRDAGVPLRYDEERQGYFIPGTYYLPPTNFTPEEALAVIVLCHELGEQHKLPFYAPARSAAAKLEGSLPARLREHLRTVTGSIHIRLEPQNSLSDQDRVYEHLVKAIGDRECVRIRYRSLTEGMQINTRLSPYRLLFSRRAWYVIGRSSLHRATRTFHLGRIAELEFTGDRYSVSRGFSLNRYLRNAWHLIPERGPDHHVVIRFSRMVASNVSEVTWHKTQKIVEQTDGSIDYHVDVSGLGEISWWILGYGDEAEVLEPVALRKLIASRIKRLCKRYGVS
jgi:predicted DNA-binding transcriptional regulator YafY